MSMLFGMFLVISIGWCIIFLMFVDSCVILYLVKGIMFVRSR